MELIELYNLIKTILLEDGFTKRDSCMEETERSSWIKEDELIDELLSGRVYPTISGYTLDVVKVFQGGSKRNSISYYLDCMHWKDSSGKAILHLKISSTQTEKTLTKKIKNFIKDYLLLINK